MAKAPKAKRYALALFELAEERQSTEAWLDELRQAEAALADRTTTMYLTVPQVRKEDKLNAVNQLLAGREQMVVNLVALLVGRQSLSLLDSVTSEYAELLHEAQGRVRAEVTTATALATDQEQSLQRSLGTALNKEVVLDSRQDPAIIGGLIVKVGDQIIDGSVRSRLGAMRHRLERESLV